MDPQPTWDDELDEIYLSLIERAGVEGCRDECMRISQMSLADVHRWVDRALSCGYIERNTDGRPARYWITRDGRDYLYRLVLLNRGGDAPPAP
jgi:hypothetical protein